MRPQALHRPSALRVGCAFVGAVLLGGWLVGCRDERPTYSLEAAIAAAANTPTYGFELTGTVTATDELVLRTACQVHDVVQMQCTTDVGGTATVVLADAGSGDVLLERDIVVQRLVGSVPGVDVGTADALAAYSHVRYPIGGVHDVVYHNELAMYRPPLLTIHQLERETVRDLGLTEFGGVPARHYSVSGGAWSGASTDTDPELHLYVSGANELRGFEYVDAGTTEEVVYRVSIIGASHAPVVPIPHADDVIAVDDLVALLEPAVARAAVAAGTEAATARAAHALADEARMLAALSGGAVTIDHLIAAVARYTDDRRYGWSVSTPDAVRAVQCAEIAHNADGVNRFETRWFVRIQDRGGTVVGAGGCSA